MPKPKAIPDGFLTASTAARLLGCSVQNIRTNYLPKLTGDNVLPGRPVRIRFAALIDLIVERRVEERTRAATPTSDDPLLADGDSPALERYRLAKAKHAELDLEQRKGELIDVGKCRDILAQWASVIRKTGDRLSKRFGLEANLMVSDAIDACDDIVRAFDDHDA